MAGHATHGRHPSLTVHAHTNSKGLCICTRSSTRTPLQPPTDSTFPRRLSALQVANHTDGPSRQGRPDLPPETGCGAGRRGEKGSRSDAQDSDLEEREGQEEGGGAGAATGTASEADAGKCGEEGGQGKEGEAGVLGKRGKKETKDGGEGRAGKAYKEVRGTLTLLSEVCG